MPRSRKKDFTDCVLTIGSSPPVIAWTAANEHFNESSAKGPCACFHRKGTPSDVFFTMSGNKHTYAGHHAVPLNDYVLQKCSDSIYSLNWGKLPTSTSTGLIQLIAEFDDTLATFTRKFWQSLSYGSFTWGVMPLVSDLMGIASALRNINAKLDSFDYADSIKVDLSQPKPTSGGGWYVSSGTANVSKRGKGDISFQHPGAQILDRLGFHPRLSTAWDLVPLSFLVDYIIPIGDFLSSYEQAGWIGAVYMRGWLTIKSEYTTSYYNYTYAPSGGDTSISSFQRWSFSDILIDTPPRDSIKTLRPTSVPTLSQLFSLFYVLVSPKLSKRVQKAIALPALGTAFTEAL
jgi:hypothetical protein